MEQRCQLLMVWLTWLGVPLLAVLIALRFGAVAGVVVLAAGVLGQVAYVRWFPHISRWMGYGSVVDQPADAGPTGAVLPAVTLYTASVCPFCPIVRRRLVDLQQSHSFDLREIDVTLRPDIVRAKGLSSIPVLEANGQVLVGNATSARIAEFLRKATPLTTPSTPGCRSRASGAARPG